VFDLVIFDLDGTLVDTAPELSEAVNETLKILGYAQVPEALARNWIGHGTRELMLHAFAHASDWSVDALRRSDAIDHAMPIFAQHYAARCGTKERSSTRSGGLNSRDVAWSAIAVALWSAKTRSTAGMLSLPQRSDFVTH